MSEIIQGSNQSDVIVAGDGNQNISAGNGDDVVDGGSGNDVIDGGNGKDTLIDGSNDLDSENAGSDSMYGGNGNDMFWWYAYNNLGNNDFANGQNGVDSINLNFSNISLNASEVSAFISAVNNFVDTVKSTGAGVLDTSAFSWDVNVQVQNMENIVTNGLFLRTGDGEGINVRPEADTVIRTVKEGQTDTVSQTELAIQTSDANGDVLTHTAAASPGKGDLEIQTNGSGQVQSVDYTATSSVFGNLSMGELETVSYSFQVNDGFGGTAIQNVNVTIEGTNNQPLALQGLAMTVIEDGSSESITLKQTDLVNDLNDNYSFAIDPEHLMHEGNPVGTLSLVQDNNNEATLTLNPGADLQSLDDGESINFIVNYTIDDGLGVMPGDPDNAPSVSDPAAIAIQWQGANDAPEVDLNGSAAGIDHSVNFVVTVDNTPVNTAVSAANLAVVSATQAVSAVSVAASVAANAGSLLGIAQTTWSTAQTGVTSAQLSLDALIAASAPQEDIDAATATLSLAQIDATAATATLSNAEVQAVTSAGELSVVQAAAIAAAEAAAAAQQAAQSATPDVDADAANIAAIDASIADPDVENLDSLQLTLSGILDGASESLSISLPIGSNISIDASSGYDAGSNSYTLLLVGDASEAEYQDALRLVQYENVAGVNTDAGDRSVSVIANDGDADSVIAQSVISVSVDMI